MRKHVFTHLKAIDVGARKPACIIDVSSTADAHGTRTHRAGTQTTRAGGAGTDMDVDRASTTLEEEEDVPTCTH